MIDGYTHLRMAAPDPLADLRARMKEGGVERALVVETWKGDDYPCLKRLIETAPDCCRVALCFRSDERDRLTRLLDSPSVSALRVRSSDLDSIDDLGAFLARSGKWLLAHAEDGAGRLADALSRLAQREPRINIYIPHLAWPARGGEPDSDWPAAIEKLRLLPSVVVGVSAISHFSQTGFPHPDVERWAETLIGMFDAGEILAGSDYPLFEAARYADYIGLASDWIRRAHPQWSPHLAAIFGERRAIHDPE